LNKLDFRRRIYKIIAGFDESYIIDSDKKIFDKLLTVPQLSGSQTVFAYWSFGREVATRQLIDICLARGQRVALPSCGSDGRLVFRIFPSAEELVPAEPYGIPEPPSSAEAVFPTEHDAVLVPALCYDERLFRIGRGCGYYDQFLANCPAMAIGLCREALIFPEIPVEAHDVPVSLLITETKTRGW
jgi:5-formyltetrahydrofolate cyclo-ligase